MGTSERASSRSWQWSWYVAKASDGESPKVFLRSANQRSKTRNLVRRSYRSQSRRRPGLLLIPSFLLRDHDIAGRVAFIVLGGYDMRKQLDPRLPILINNNVKKNHRSFIVLVGDKGRDQVSLVFDG